MCMSQKMYPAAIFNVALHYTRKMVPIIGRASLFLVFFVCTLRGWSFQKQNRKEEKETEKQQTYQFTQSYNILHRLQVHCVTLNSNINTTFIYIYGIILESCSSFFFLSMANSRCLLATTFSSLSFHSNSFS